MAVVLELTLDEAREVVDRAVAVVDALGALKKRRKGVTPAQRYKIGQRDGWVCGICHALIDPTLVFKQALPHESRAHAEHLAHYGVEDHLVVIAWVGADGNKAHSAYEWFWLARRASELSAEILESYSRTFWEAMWPVMRARTEHNRRTASVEHLHPVALGGTNAPDNLVIAHLGCNTNFNPDAENADLVAAPKHALRFLTDLKRGSTDGAALVGLLGRVCAVLDACGVAVPDRGELVARLPVALGVVHESFADMWLARRDCRRHLTHLRMEAAHLGTDEGRARVSGIRRELEAVPWRGHTAEWWRARRDELPALSPAFVERLRAWDLAAQ